MKRVLLTGATGFIGGYLLSLLQKEGVQVIVLGRHAPEAVAHFEYWDMVTEKHGLHDLFKEVDVVFHAAGKVHGMEKDDRTLSREFDAFMRGNVCFVDAIARSRSCPRVVLMGSMSVYRDSIGKVSHACDEGAVCDPMSVYGKYKLAEERLFQRLENLCILRSAMVYGPGCKGNLPRMIESIAHGRFPSLPEFGNRRSMVHVEDVARAAWLAAVRPEASGRVYNITDGEGYSTRQIYVWICEALGKAVPRWQVPAGALRVLARAGDVIGRLRGRRFMFDSSVLDKLAGSAWYSNEAIVRELDWQPQRRLNDSLPEIVTHLRRDGVI